MTHECPSCGYDLSPQARDLDAGARISCSECGTTTTERQSRRAAMGYKSPRRIPGWIFVLGFLAVIVGAWVVIRMLIRVF